MSFEAYVNGEARSTRVRATYPFVRILISTHMRALIHASHTVSSQDLAFTDRPVTRPDLFRTYLTEQIRLLIENHGVPVEIGKSVSRSPSISPRGLKKQLRIKHDSMLLKCDFGKASKFA